MLLPAQSLQNIDSSAKGVFVDGLSGLTLWSPTLSPYFQLSLLLYVLLQTLSPCLSTSLIFFPSSSTLTPISAPSLHPFFFYLQNHDLVFLFPGYVEIPCYNLTDPNTDNQEGDKVLQTHSLTAHDLTPASHRHRI